MDINEASLRGFFVSSSTLFNEGLALPKSHWKTVAMLLKSSSSQTDYAWLNDLPGIREWIGDRLINRLSASKYTIENRLFEDTIAVKRTKIEDDSYGIYGPLFKRMGELTGEFPDTLVFDLLKDGHIEKCFDGQYFFDTDHKGFNEAGAEVSVSNVATGAAPAWYLLDCGQVLKPLVYQERLPFAFQSLTDPNDPHVFFKDEFVYGVRGRSNAGFGLWQLAYRSTEVLSEATYTAARTAMMGVRKATGKRMGITPTHLVVPPELEATGRKLLNALLIDGGDSNIWNGSAELLVSHHI